MQNGTDTEGFSGFLFEDILKTAKSFKKVRCNYCKKTGANVTCSARNCHKCYHTGCAMQDNALFKFNHSFPIICSSHPQKAEKVTKKLDNICRICCDQLDKKKSILIPCCKNSYFHKRCLQKYAHTSGSYHFKCPLCADKEICLKQLPELGIFIPVRDAQWELDDDFQDMATPPLLLCERCDNKIKNADKPYLWKMCQTCGSSGIHYECDKDVENAYICKECIEIHEKLMKSQAKKRRLEMKKKLINGKPRAKPSPFLLCSDEELCTTDDDDEDEEPVPKRYKYQETTSTATSSRA